MSKIVKFVAALGFIFATAGVAQAMPAAPPAKAPALTVEAAFGCGPGFRPGPAGRCIAERRYAPVVRRKVCPRGMHLNRYGNRCVPNRY